MRYMILSPICLHTHAGILIRRSVNKMPRGFTLLEMLVVLTIVGLLAGVALPRLQKLVSSVEVNSQRTDIKLALEGLGYQAYVNSKPSVLSGVLVGAAAEQAGLDLPLQVPKGWTIQIPQPIHYAMNGVCDGGKIFIMDPDHLRETFVLKPPKCRLEQVNNSE